MPLDCTSSLLNLPAPAKVNRFLHIIGRRPDGYHLLESVFEFISLADTISLRARSDGRIVRTGDMAEAADDLCVRAAKLLKEKTGCPLGVEISVTKRIPSGAGLGGGSSDAATTLIALNRLWGLGLHRSELAAAGLALGADVPFFIGGQNAFVEGIGERLTPINPPEEWLAVIWPGVHSATASVFKDPDLTRNSPSMKIADLSARLSAGRLGETGRNDLEPVVAKACPPVAEALSHLSKFGQARMTGSGSAVFAAANGEREARQMLEGIPQDWLGFAVRTLPSHPLSDWLDNI